MENPKKQTNKQTNKKTYRSTEASWLWGKQINQGSTLVWRFRGGESFAINSDMTETLLLHVCFNRQVSKYILFVLHIGYSCILHFVCTSVCFYQVWWPSLWQ